jgi:hypothetical protein
LGAEAPAPLIEMAPPVPPVVAPGAPPGADGGALGPQAARPAVKAIAEVESTQRLTFTQETIISFSSHCNLITLQPFSKDKVKLGNFCNTKRLNFVFLLQIRIAISHPTNHH